MMRMKERVRRVGADSVLVFLLPFFPFLSRLCRREEDGAPNRRGVKKPPIFTV